MRLPFRNLHNPEIQANFEALEELTDIYLTDSGWIAPVLAGTWEGTHIEYRKQGNVVRLRGKTTKLGGSGAVIFTLPEGFRPPFELQAPGVQEEAHGVAHIKVEPNGKVSVFYDGAAQVNLSSITFTVD